ncbi:MAG: hypothetical protein KF900_10720 [Bacteroidetes bacterium]|nr:hypothetical protein [Bacteroidota bacterium]
MKKRTLKTIIILVSLLFLNIEAAQAGLIHKFKVYIGQEFSGQLLFYTLGITFTIASLGYIMYAPAFKEEKAKTFRERLKNDFQSQKERVRKISQILTNAPVAEQSQF